MSYGLQVWDEQSRLLLDTSDRITRLLATYSGTVYYNSSQMLWIWSINIPNFINDNHSYLLINTSNLAVGHWCPSAETVNLSYVNYYSSGSIDYTIQHMGF
jgi:hypothetical protein